MIDRLVEFLLPSLAAGDAMDAGYRRLRKFVAVIAVIAVVCVAAVVLQVVNARWLSAIETGSVAILTVAALVALRANVPLWVVSTGYLSVGLGIAGMLALQGGTNGLVSVFWMSSVPLIALTVGGRRSGYVTLALTLVTMSIILYCIDQGITPPTVLKEDATFGIRTASMLGAVMTLFFLVLNYHSENERSIVRLEEKNRALDTARADADRANRAKSEFLATISHEIRTPLNGVTGMISLLQDERDLERVRDGMRVIRQSADTLLAVINDVLDLSKIESNRLELESAPVAPRGQLQLVIDLLQAQAAERNTELELVIGHRVPAWVVTDPTRFRQVALNLVSNGVKFTRDGMVVCRLDAIEGALTLEVRDTGIGMDEATQQRLFTPFVQADASTTRKFGGTGLGLVITRRLVDAMGGRLSFESKLGVGSVFRVTIPVRETAAPRTVSSERLRVAPARKVLLVEDNAINQLVAKRLLERGGHSVLLAANGRRALEICESERFDAILMDCHMPELDGFDATRELRARGVTTPIYALTAAVTTDDQARCLEVGMDGLLGKPLSLDKLAEVLRELPRAETRTAA